jgi:capsid protein
MTVLDVAYEWVHAGMPWWDPSKEIDGDMKAISAGLDNPYRVCQRVGTDFEANIKKIAQAREFAESHNVPLTFGEFAEPVEYEVDEPVEEVGNEEEAEGNEEEATGNED